MMQANKQRLVHARRRFSNFCVVTDFASARLCERRKRGGAALKKQAREQGDDVGLAHAAWRRWRRDGKINVAVK